jgi:hypothetical protein
MIYPMHLLLQADVLTDTTALGYRIGYSIGSWLPFLLIAGLALLIILRRYRQNPQ